MHGYIPWNLCDYAIITMEMPASVYLLFDHPTYIDKCNVNIPEGSAYGVYILDLFSIASVCD